MIIKFFNWYGGKQRVINLLLSLVPDGIEYWHEACMGSAVLTLNSVRHKVEVINDLDPELVNLFTLMADEHKGKILMDKLLNIEYSMEVFDNALKLKGKKIENLNEFERAANEFILITQSFNSTRKSFSKSVSQTEYTNMLHIQLPEVHKRLKRVQVSEKNAIEVVDEAKFKESAFVFIDPPYRHKLRSKSATKEYCHEMDDAEHEELLESIKDAKCKIMLCGYREKDGNDLYDQYLLSDNSKWRHYKLADLKKSCQNKSVKDIGEEWVWLNYEPPEYSKYFINHSSFNQ
jgi:DNA adenine methylase